MLRIGFGFGCAQGKLSFAQGYRLFSLAMTLSQVAAFT